MLKVRVGDRITIPNALPQYWVSKIEADRIWIAWPADIIGSPYYIQNIENNTMHNGWKIIPKVKPIVVI